MEKSQEPAKRPAQNSEPGTPKKRTRRFSLVEVPKQPFAIISTFISEIIHLLNEAAAQREGDDAKELIIENLRLVKGKVFQD